MSVNDYTAALPTEQREITAKLVTLIEEALPGAGAVWHGHPVWSAGAKPGERPVAFFKAYPKYVTFGFWRGAELGDDRLALNGRGMGTVKLTTVADVDEEVFAGWLKAAGKLEN
ncbi:DUF1801 domain-containing protein [Phytomonospora endophytica]|uniref:YdhG-like domain-containing protein n=1 Tax=Phytomonospora endophytica TaxID=714109 RepID=A0A841FUQ0_9ACTN|nr:DUF1801 domain-containing protein [Phytomonospora endophytica]MBB6036239.1 hypothetical protein [Phytomonospora endophytica]GIG67145.1 hypothetical protein Pen01_34400 [Phytomonospora endophytica]